LQHEARGDAATIAAQVEARDTRAGPLRAQGCLRRSRRIFLLGEERLRSARVA
jgi:hypothetical protein